MKCESHTVGKDKLDLPLDTVLTTASRAKTSLTTLPLFSLSAAAAGVAGLATAIMSETVSSYINMGRNSRSSMCTKMRYMGRFATWVFIPERSSSTLSTGADCDSTSTNALSSEPGEDEVCACDSLISAGDD